MFERITQVRKNRKKILGLNERYLEYIRPQNLKKAIDIADDKVLTKKVLRENYIPVPTKIAVVRSLSDLDDLKFDEFPQSFVIKPVHGVRGGGVEIFYNRDKNGNWIRGDKSRLDIGDIRNLIRDILDGKYSLNNEPDIALIEERVKPHKVFRYHTYKGTPDVRVIVYNRIPVMAMLRLPTEKSNGKANLDLGAIGTGIDIAVGKTTTAIYGKSGKIELIPNYKIPISGLRIPYWDKILEYSIKASDVTGLGFAGIDFLIDRDLGPLIVEMNARPGLSIQLANDSGLRWRLKKAGGIKVKTVAKGVRLAKDLFGGEIEEGIESISGKEVIGINEKVTVTGKNEKNETVKAKIDTGADSTSIDADMAERLGYIEAVELFRELNTNFKIGDTREERIEQEKELKKKYIGNVKDVEDMQFIRSSHGFSIRPYIKLNLKIDETEFETQATIYDRSKLSFPIIIGRKSLYKFLIDPSKTRI